MIICKTRQIHWVFIKSLLEIKMPNERPHGKTNNPHTRKQRRRSASQFCFRYLDSTVPLLLKSEISSF